MKITISYVPGESRQAIAALTALRALLPDAKLRSSISHPPFKHLYLTTRRPGKPCESGENA